MASPAAEEARARNVILALAADARGVSDMEIFDALFRIPVPPARALELVEELRRERRIHLRNGRWHAG